MLGGSSSPSFCFAAATTPPPAGAPGPLRTADERPGDGAADAAASTVLPIPPAALDAAEGPFVVGTVTTPEGIPTGATVVLCEASEVLASVVAGDDGTFRAPAK